jgi:mannose-6-phosphate isomerase-like protein (cupin superfamily)
LGLISGYNDDAPGVARVPRNFGNLLIPRVHLEGLAVLDGELVGHLVQSPNRSSRLRAAHNGGSDVTDETAADFTVKRLDEMEAAWGGGFVRVRASLGASAFGMQVHELPPDSGDMFPEHDHVFDGQEEIYLLLRGTATLHLPGCVVDLDPDTFVRVGPATRRRLRTGADGARILVLGGVPGAAYEPAAFATLGGEEILPCPTASTSLMPDGPPPQLP